MSDLDPALDHLIAVLTRLEVPLIADLQPGLSLRRIDELTKDLPHDFPQELRRLYAWRNGSEPATGRNQLYPGGGFVPLVYALVNYKGLVEAYEGGFKGTEIEMTDVYDLRWFPVFLNYGNSAAVVVCGDAPDAGSVWSLLLEDTSQREHLAESVGEFIEVVARRWESGAFFFEPGVGPCEDYAALAAERRAIQQPSTDVDRLVRSLVDGNPGEQAAALRELKQYLYPDAIPLLVRLLEHRDSQTRRNAAGLLGQMGDPSVVPALMSVLDDRAYSVRESAKWSISVLQRHQKRSQE